MTIPVDRGWAWVVLLGVSFNQFVVMSFVKSMGLIFASLLDEFRGSATVTSLMQTIATGISFFAAPVFSGLGDMFTVRRMTLLGGLLQFVIGIVVSFVDTLELVVFPFGIVCGIGAGLVLTNAPVILARYFDERRALANGLMFTAGGMGGIVGPLLIQWALDFYGVPQVFLFVGAWLLQTCIGGALFRPLTWWQPKAHQKTPKLTVETDQPEVKQPIEPKMLTRKCSDHDHDTAVSGSKDKESCCHLMEQCTSENDRHRKRIDSTVSPVPSRYVSALNLATVSITDIPAELSQEWSHVEELRDLHHQKWSLRSIVSSFYVLQRILFVTAPDGNRTPLYNISVLADPSVLVFSIASSLSTAFFALGFVTPAHCELAIDLSTEDIRTLLMALGISETCGRLFVAVISDRPFIKRRRVEFGAVLMFLAFVFTSVAAFLATSFVTQLIFLILGPFCMGGMIALHITLLVDLVGLQKLSTAIGMLMVVEGVTACGSPLLIGVLRDVTGGFVAAYVYLSACFFVSSVCLSFVPILVRRRKPSSDVVVAH